MSITCTKTTSCTGSAFSPSVSQRCSDFSPPASQGCRTTMRERRHWCRHARSNAKTSESVCVCFQQEICGQVCLRGRRFKSTIKGSTSHAQTVAHTHTNTTYRKYSTKLSCSTMYFLRHVFWTTTDRHLSRDHHAKTAETKRGDDMRSESIEWECRGECESYVHKVLIERWGVPKVFWYQVVIDVCKELL